MLLLVCGFENTFPYDDEKKEIKVNFGTLEMRSPQMKMGRGGGH